MNRQQIKEAMKLYIITDRTWLGDNSLAQQVEESIKAGATFVQVREKNTSDEAFLEVSKQIKIVTDKYHIPFVINDNISVALEVDADGVHVGQSDMAVREARKALGPDKIIGASAGNLDEALAAQRAGADYLGVGAMFSTSTKDDADSASFETLKEICQHVDIPVVAIGGINKDNMMQLGGTCVDGICVISAIFAQDDIAQATRVLAKQCEALVKN